MVNTLKSYPPFTLIGVIFIVAGIILVILPLIAQYLPSLQKIPWIIIWTYKSGNFVFVTSPILIIITVISFILTYLKH
jgi:hypothetical protein